MELSELVQPQRDRVTKILDRFDCREDFVLMPDLERADHVHVVFGVSKGRRRTVCVDGSGEVI